MTWPEAIAFSIAAICSSTIINNLIHKMGKRRGNDVGQSIKVSGGRVDREGFKPESR